ncbi:MAG: DUF6361 family protein [Polyangiaceae bacterium]
MTASTFSWLDHSDRERQRMLDAIDRFAENDTRDELGLGSIRDGLSELFFPGTNTIQTRARYFLFVPWIYRALEASTASAENFAARARRDELALVEALCATGNPEGVIGARARAKLKRLPSNIYWLGLREWGIRRFSGSQDDYYQRVRRPELSAPPLDDDEDVVEGSARGNWHAGLPDPPKDLLKSADLQLTREEALYLRERVRQKQGTSLLSYLIDSKCKMEGALPWLHPAVTTLPARLSAPLEHARLFSETMHGAALLYNLQLTESLPPEGEPEHRVAALRAELHDWCTELAQRSDAIAHWNHNDFWALAKRQSHVRGSTEHFVNSWWKLETWRDPELAISSPAARALIESRERALKGSRARLGNQRALERWRGAAGLSRLNYRWGVTTRFINDIHTGLAIGGEDARTA